MICPNLQWLRFKCLCLTLWCTFLYTYIISGIFLTISVFLFFSIISDILTIQTPKKISGLLQMRHISKAHWARFRWSCLGPWQKLGAFVENALEVPKRVDLQRAALHFKERWILWKRNHIFIVMVLRKKHFLILGEHMIELIDVDSALLLTLWILKYLCAMRKQKAMNISAWRRLLGNENIQSCGCIANAQIICHRSHHWNSATHLPIGLCCNGRWHKHLRAESHIFFSRGFPHQIRFDVQVVNGKVSQQSGFKTKNSMQTNITRFSHWLQNR